MSAMSDLIEDWIQIRSTLQRQLKTLESSEAQVPLDVPGEMTVNHITQWIADINSLLKEYTAHRL
jgi:ornithine carbamoyltransferase